MKYPLIITHFVGESHGFEIKTAILTVSWRERTNSERLTAGSLIKSEIAYFVQMTNALISHQAIK